MVRPRSHATGENPFNKIQIADIGDVVATLYNVEVDKQELVDHNSMNDCSGCL